MLGIRKKCVIINKNVRAILCAYQKLYNRGNINRMSTNINTSQDNSKVSFIHSLKFKIMLLVMGFILLANAANIVIAMSGSRTLIKEQAHSSMLSLTEAYSRMLEYEIEEEGGTMPVEMLEGILSNAKLEGVSSSYAYMVARDGIMLYHPTADKIGQPVENDAVKRILSQLNSGKVPGPGVIEYDYKGVRKYAAYAVLDNQSILVVTADESDIFSGTNKMSSRMTMGSVCVLALGAVLSLFAVGYMMRTLDFITNIIKDTSEFNFTKNPASTQIVKKKDEIGMMGRAIRIMRGNLRDMVGNIEDVSEQITSNVNKVKTISKEINNKCTDNSATTQQLAAGMEETSATTITIQENIGRMKEGAEQIQQRAKEGEERSHEVRKRAEDLKKTTNEATERTTKMYESISEKTEQAIESSRAVDKINELTGAIMSISSQTSLLALNASIEAARAGEAGRGFAVVATEIGNLASQTSETVRSINTIVSDVNHAVSSLAESLQSTVDFLEKVVLKDYQQFAEVGENYSNDSQEYSDGMTNIEGSINQLADTIGQIIISLNGINSTVNEAAVGITDIADKTTNVVEQTVQNNELVADCIDSVGRLNQIASMFRME